VRAEMLDTRSYGKARGYVPAGHRASPVIAGLENLISGRWWSMVLWLWLWLWLWLCEGTGSSRAVSSFRQNRPESNSWLRLTLL
jgi:hypothetical protein